MCVYLRNKFQVFSIILTSFRQGGGSNFTKNKPLKSLTRLELKLCLKPLAFTSYKAFLKNKKRPGTSLPVSFSAWFLKKNISLVIFHKLTKFHCLVAFTSWNIEQYVYCNCLLTRLRRHKFWNQPYFSNQAVSSTWSKSQDKTFFLSFLKGFHWSK